MVLSGYVIFIAISIGTPYLSNPRYGPDVINYRLVCKHLIKIGMSILAGSLHRLHTK